MESGVEPVITVQNLTSAYGDMIVIDDISFEINQGEVFVIMGGSGCGKSTVLKHIIGLHKPLHGSILIEGIDIVTAGRRQKKELLRKIGVAYQNGALFGSMTVHENIRLVLDEFTSLPEKAKDAVARMKLKLVGLESAADKAPSELSGGMKKRAAIARALALDPDIIFLDEPSAGLDPVTSADLDQLIMNLARTLEKTFVIVSHELDSIFTVADNVIMLDKATKKIIAKGKPKQLKENSENPFVRKFFNRQPSEYSMQ
ncbi:MAG: ABC transporter ATP-binding protein [Planctomycetota bacterium]|jgi:phospholipid/cholesterol/gamma-HCH transport system ATP-binding protein